MIHLKNIILLISISFITLFSSAVYGVEYLIGAKAWYANWDSSLKDAGKEVPWMGWQYMETGSGWLYGPNVAVIFSERVNLSVSYLYGNMQAQFEASYRATDGGNTYDYYMVGKNEITRQDVDSALSFQMMSRLKLFLGFKYQIVDMTMKQSGAQWRTSDPTIGGFTKAKMTFEQENYAPALGLGTSIPLGEMFAITANVSALYMRGEQHITHRSVFYESGDFNNPHTGEPFENTMDLKGYGINADPAILLYVNDINLVIMLGFRYQYVKYDAKWKRPQQGVDSQMDNLSETLYGAYLSILYKI